MSHRKTQLDIQGMSCANCSQTITEALQDLDGVETATVNYATDEAQVVYNPADTSIEALYDAIEAAGYSPVREESADGGPDEDARDAARREEIRRQRRLTLFGAALSAPMLVGDHSPHMGQAQA